jgi:hypothetical protein
VQKKSGDAEEWPFFGNDLLQAGTCWQAEGGISENLAYYKYRTHQNQVLLGSFVM